MLTSSTPIIFGKTFSFQTLLLLFDFDIDTKTLRYFEVTEQLLTPRPDV